MIKMRKWREMVKKKLRYVYFVNFHDCSIVLFYLIFFLSFFPLIFSSIIIFFMFYFIFAYKYTITVFGKHKGRFKKEISMANGLIYTGLNKLLVLFIVLYECIRYRSVKTKQWWIMLYMHLIILIWDYCAAEQ